MVTGDDLKRKRISQLSKENEELKKEIKWLLGYFIPKRPVINQHLQLLIDRYDSNN